MKGAKYSIFVFNGYREDIAELQKNYRRLSVSVTVTCVHGNTCVTVTYLTADTSLVHIPLGPQE